MEIENLGVIAYDIALSLQEKTHESVRNNLGPEKLFLLEHPHVFTVGRRLVKGKRSKPHYSHLKLPTFHVSRGGDITYHGPGQLVGYPILDLRRRSLDIYSYLRNLEECLIRTVSEFGLSGYRRKGFTGLWTDKGKLASIGVGVRKWITMHGFALNVAPEMHYFKMIDPCGMPDCPVTSMSEILGRVVSIREIEPIISKHLTQVLKPKDSLSSEHKQPNQNLDFSPEKSSRHLT